MTDAATRAAIRRASQQARNAMRELDRAAIDALLTIYEQAADQVRAAVRAAADADDQVTLAHLRPLLRQVDDILQAMGDQRDQLLASQIEQAATLGTRPYTAQGVAATGRAGQALLTSDAAMRIHESAVRFVREFEAADGLRLSDRLWALDQGARETLSRAIGQAVVQGWDASRAVAQAAYNGLPVPLDVQQRARAGRADRVASLADLLTGGDDAQVWKAERVFRTEINRAHGEAYMAGGERAAGFAGWRFLLSPLHPRPDICDLLAAQNLHGLGAGVYAQLIGLAGAFKDASSGMASYRAAVDQLKAERSTLFVDYLRSLGDELGAVAEETRLATQGFDAVQLGLYSMNEELRRTIAINSQRSQLSSSLAAAANVKGYGRDRELAALVDPSSRALQQWIYRIEDAQDAISAAADVNRDAADAARDMQSALQQQRDTAKTTVSELEQQVNQLKQASKGASSLLNDIAVSLGATDGRAAGLRATLASGADIDERLSAARELYDIIKQGDQASLAAQQKQLEAAKGLVAYGRQLQDYVAGLKTSDLSPLKPEQQLAEARDAFQALVQQAQAGDADARSKLQGASDTYLKLAQAFDPEGYATTVFANVSSTLDQLGAAAQTSGKAQVDLLSDLVDASGSNNKLSADQVAQLGDLQRTVERLYGEAASGAATSGAQLAVANASLASIESQLAASESAVQALEQATKESVKAAENRLAQVQTEAAQYLASVQLQVLATDPVPGLLAGLPGGIASALAPLINGTANVGSSAGGIDAGRAQTIRAYAATLSNDEAGAMAMYQAAVNNGISSAELEAALNLPAGGANEWAKARGLPAFALGGIAGPGDALVGEHGPEVVRFLQPAQVYRTGTGPSAPVDLQPLLAEMASLRAEVRRLREQNNRGHEVNAVATQATGQAMAQALERGAAKGTRAGLAAAVGVPT